jgi:hypothetical protein
VGRALDDYDALTVGEAIAQDLGSFHGNADISFAVEDD